MSRSSDSKPSSVSATAMQGGDALHLHWVWAERAVWTERMLTALETGVKGGVWFSLMDKVFSERTLLASAHRVVVNKGAPGVDHVSVEEFADQLDSNVKKLSAALRDGSYEPNAIRRVMIPKPGSNEQRPLGIPTVRDRVVQGALRFVLEPIFDWEFAEHSYGFRPGQGCKDALRRVDSLLNQGYSYVVDVDLKSFFDTIPHDRLLDRLRERIADERVLSLVEAFLKTGIFDGLEETNPIAGAPQGAVLSPLLSNIYLNPLDHVMAQLGFEMVRYADDFVIVCRSGADAERALTQVRLWCEAEGLTLHPTKTQVVDVRVAGVEFLGYRFEVSKKGKLVRRPRKKSLKKLQDAIRAKTKRTNGQSLDVIIQSVNRTLRGWFGYFQHSCRTSLVSVDGWVRMRLRSILRRRAGLRGVGNGVENQRYPNAFFASVGLFSLESAHRLACRPP